jgi:HK97 gp10 family phage protein
MARSRGTDLLGKKEKMLGPGAKIEWDDRQLAIEINKSMNSKLRSSAEIVADYARANINDGKIKRAATQFASWKGRKPGSLRKSVKVVKSKFKGGGWLVKVGGHDTYYWFFVEYGTSKMAPQHFMRDALRDAKARIRARFRRTA